MSNTSFTPVAGSDGQVPIYNQGGRFQIWALSEIFMGSGTIASSKYVPLVNDYVINTDTNSLFKVTIVDPTTYTPTLVPVTNVFTGEFTPESILLGVGPGTDSDTYRIYIDKAVLPYTLCVDARLKVAGSAAHTAVIFRGSQLNGNAVAISAIYDQSGNLLGQSIPLELVGMDGTNIAIKTVPVCNTNADLPDGEVVTAVFYSVDGTVLSKRQLLVENTAFIRSNNTAVKYITGITLESPFLSQSDNTLIQYPINIPLNGLMLTGVVTYSDGSQLRMPVDGTKFSMFGFAGYIATIVGQKFNIVLKYTLSPGEVVYGAQNVGNQGTAQFITATYKATTLKADGAFSVKLYCYPVWIDAANGYKLQWYMYTLDRTAMFNVTPYVHFNTNSPLFNPVAYGITQALSVYINMQDVSAVFTNYKNVQNISVTLVAPATARTTNWTIGFTPNQNPPYGVNNFAASAVSTPPVGIPPVWQVNLAAGSTTLDDWLQRMYFATLPLTDPIGELVPPTPNKFALVINGQDVVFPISSWNTSLTVPGAVPDNTTLIVKFLLVLPNNTLQLSVCGLPVYQS